MSELGGFWDKMGWFFSNNSTKIDCIPIYGGVFIFHCECILKYKLDVFLERKLKSKKSLTNKNESRK